MSKGLRLVWFVYVATKLALSMFVVLRNEAKASQDFGEYEVLVSRVLVISSPVWDS
jgi:hypothetical protein